MSSTWTRRRLLQAAATLAAQSRTPAGAQTPAPASEPTGPDGAQKHERAFYAGRARAIVEALQTRWYHAAPIPGWGQEQNEWNAHCTLDTLIDYTRLTGDRSYLDTIRFVAANQPLLDSAINDGVDDMAWAAIAHVKAYRLLHREKSLAAARQIFATMTGYWDDVCRGGVWWDRKRTYKNAVTNELFLLLAASLYETTHQPDYLKWTLREWDWFGGSGMINADNLISDGLRQCRNSRDTTWTYNQGVVLGGLTALYRFTQERSYLDQAARIATATIETLIATVDGVAILKEPCAVPNSDQQQFKGIFVKHLAQLTLALPPSMAEPRRRFTRFLHANADVLWTHARNDANLCNVYWHGGDQPSIVNATTQTAALDLLNAAVAVTR
jgi:predicted alpha-1,6-mannanase (GH76 family)